MPRGMAKGTSPRQGSPRETPSRAARGAPSAPPPRSQRSGPMPRAGPSSGSFRTHAVAQQVRGDAPRQEGPACDEGGEEADRGGTFPQRCRRLLRRVDAAGGDDIDGVAELVARAPNVGERGRENLRAGQSPRLLRQPRLLDPARVAVV